MQSIRDVMHLYQPDKSVVAEHSISVGYPIDFSRTSILNRTSGLDHLVKETTEIHLKKNNFNRDSDFVLNQGWSPKPACC